MFIWQIYVLLLQEDIPKLFSYSLENTQHKQMCCNTLLKNNGLESLKSRMWLEMHMSKVFLWLATYFFDLKNVLRHKLKFLTKSSNLCPKLRYYWAFFIMLTWYISILIILKEEISILLSLHQKLFYSLFQLFRSGLQDDIFEPILTTFTFRGGYVSIENLLSLKTEASIFTLP